jgi:hypothetical protein
MNERRLLKSQIIKAWHQCIAIDYRLQRINSERSLQASFWSRLNPLLSKNRRIFIEPCIVIKTSTATIRVFPDLVICNTREVIGVLELKYKPRAGPEYRKDIASLAIIAKHRDSIVVSNQRFRGQPVNETIYALSQNILFVWAGVHAITSSANKNNPIYPLYSAGYDELQGCFVELHAETNVNSLPKIYARS